jgi:hypothetical protein
MDNPAKSRCFVLIQGNGRLGCLALLEANRAVQP